MTTQTPIEPRRPTSAPTPQQAPKIHRVEVYWHAVTYKTVALYLVLLFVIVIAGIYVAIPDWTTIATTKINKAIGNVDNDPLTITQTQAKFVNLDGRVQVKKVNSVTWVDADYHTPLDKGDLIQTASDGAARITFADGTEYTVKAETLVTVEENNVTKDRANTAVRISTGEVNLATPTWSSRDSQAAISVEDATAYVQQNSRATVKNDPNKNEHEIVVATGGAEVQRGGEKIELTQYEKVSFANGGATQKSNVLAPPGLVSPLNLAPIISETPKTAQIRFEWQPVEDAVGYTLRISPTTMFTKLVKEVKVSGTSAEVSGLESGDYFWNVTASDAKKQTSEFSETFKFTLVAQGKTQEMLLDIESTQIHGRVAELIGKTEPGAALIINGQAVANISPDGTFRHFTEPLEPGQHTIVVIGSNRRGGTAKQQVSIVVPK
ncbi:MAG TPA: FecR domain-containing protein [Candidatus Acidoferrum sp.]|nr:FecR domain-containing protein [Candidatus Acidoferrum sp.]